MLYSQIHPRSNHASTQQQQQHTRFLVEPNADYEQSDDQQIEKSLIDLPCKPCEVGRGICQLLTADPGRTPFFFLFLYTSVLADSNASEFFPQKATMHVIQLQIKVR